MDAPIIIKAKKKMTAVAKIHDLPHFDISSEAWREYVYPDGSTLKIVGAKTLIVQKGNETGYDRHRLIVDEGNEVGEYGMYVVPGWLAVRWQTPDKKHGIIF